MASWAPPRVARAPTRERALAARRRQDGVLRLGRHVISNRDARVLVEHLGEAREHLAVDAARLSATDASAAALCEAARARVSGDLELVAAALARCHSAS